MKKCPICNSASLTVIRQHSSQEAAMHVLEGNQDKTLLTKVSQYIENIIWESESAFYKHCNECGFEFSSPFKAADSHLYNILYSQSKIDQPFWKWDFQEAFKLIPKESGQFNLLDIGSGSGHFLKKIDECFSGKAQLYAIEYSDECRKYLSDFGVSSYSSLQGVKELGPESLDYVCMFQVLEHIDDFNSLLKLVRDSLKDGGLLIITVPNFLQRKLYDQAGVHEDMPPVHISRFSQQSLRILAKNNGFKVNFYQVEKSKGYRRVLRFAYMALRHNEFYLKTRNIFSSRVTKKIATAIFLLVTVVRNASCVTKLAFKKQTGVSQMIILEK
jgi:SAM-dependent methyltransferase|tara:strand:- start:10612 stop:11598 length:987 start_codon:yes stop_codon:yes gene_type:complete